MGSCFKFGRNKQKYDFNNVPYSPAGPGGTYRQSQHFANDDDTPQSNGEYHPKDDYVHRNGLTNGADHTKDNKDIMKDNDAHSISSKSSHGSEKKAEVIEDKHEEVVEVKAKEVEEPEKAEAHYGRYQPTGYNGRKREEDVEEFEEHTHSTAVLGEHQVAYVSQTRRDSDASASSVSSTHSEQRYDVTHDHHDDEERHSGAEDETHHDDDEEEEQNVLNKEAEQQIARVEITVEDEANEHDHHQHYDSDTPREEDTPVELVY